MDKSAGIPQNASYEGQPGDHPFGNNQPGAAPPAYSENAYPQANPAPSVQGYGPPGQAYGSPGQAYGPPGQAYGPPGQGYGQPGQGYGQPGQGSGQGYGQGYAHPGQGYPQPAPGYGYPQQQLQHTNTNIVVAQPLIQSQVVTGPLPPDHMCAAIFVTLCCFWPTGIVAIMRASEARNALARGDVASAHANASSAKSMVTISVVIGVISFVVVAIIIGVYVGVVLKSINDIDDRYN